MPARETQPHDEMAHRPIPSAMNREPAEQGFRTVEQFRKRVQEQALAKSPRPRQEVMLALVEQPSGEASLVHVLAPGLPNLPERLNPNGQPLRHARHLTLRVSAGTIVGPAIRCTGGNLDTHLAHRGLRRGATPTDQGDGARISAQDILQGRLHRLKRLPMARAASASR